MNKRKMEAFAREATEGTKTEKDSAEFNQMLTAQARAKPSVKSMSSDRKF